MRNSIAGIFAVLLAVLVIGADGRANAANLGDVLNEIGHAVAGDDFHNRHSPRRIGDGTGHPFGPDEFDHGMLPPNPYNHENLGQSILHNIERNLQGGPHYRDDYGRMVGPDGRPDHRYAPPPPPPPPYGGDPTHPYYVPPSPRHEYHGYSGW